MAFHDSRERTTFKPCSLVICGPGEGQTDQYASAIQDAVRMLHSTWEPTGITSATATKRTGQSDKNTSLHTGDQICSVPALEPGCVIPAGGTFEFLLNRVLLQHGRSRSVSANMNMEMPAVSQVLADALLTVPRQIYSQSPRCFLQTRAKLLSFIQTPRHPFSSLYKREDGDNLLEEGQPSMYHCREADSFMSSLGLESVSCKYQLLLAVLQCLSNLLQVDTVLHTHTDLHTHSKRTPDISWEDEAEDWEWFTMTNESHKLFFSQYLGSVLKQEKIICSLRFATANLLSFSPRYNIFEMYVGTFTLLVNHIP